MSDLVHNLAQGYLGIKPLNSYDEQVGHVCYLCGSRKEVDIQPSPPPNSTRVPCNARGMTNVEHMARTAYIEIPANPSHGLLLFCSNAECVSSGRKFRYCAVCVKPVAKRNFTDRHLLGHNLVESAKANVASPGCMPQSSPPSHHQRQRSRTVSHHAHEMASIAKQAKERKEEQAIDMRPTKMIKLASSEAKVARTPVQDEVLDIRPNFQNADASANLFDSLDWDAMPQEEEFSVDFEVIYASFISSYYDDDADEDYLFDLPDMKQD